MRLAMRAGAPFGPGALALWSVEQREQDAEGDDRLNGASSVNLLTVVIAPAEFLFAWS